MTETKKEYEYWLARIRHLPNQKKYLLHTHMKSAERVYYIEETEMRKLTFLNEKERNTIMQAQKEKNIKITAVYTAVIFIRDSRLQQSPRVQSF